LSDGEMSDEENFRDEVEASDKKNKDIKPDDQARAAEEEQSEMARETGLRGP
jgi:hypothetical protein